MIGPFILAMLGLAVIAFALGVADHHDLAGVILGVSGVLCCLVAVEWSVLKIDGAWWFVPLAVGLISSPVGMIAMGMNLGRWLARRHDLAPAKTRRDP